MTTPTRPREVIPAPKPGNAPDPDAYRRAVEDAAKSAPPPKAKKSAPASAEE